MRAHDYTTLFKTDHMLKDVEFCLQEAKSAGVPFPSASHVRDLLAAAVAAGHGDADFAALLAVVEERAGRRV